MHQFFSRNRKRESRRLPFAVNVILNVNLLDLLRVLIGSFVFLVDYLVFRSNFPVSLHDRKFFAKCNFERIMTNVRWEQLVT